MERRLMQKINPDKLAKKLSYIIGSGCLLFMIAFIVYVL